eukprot:5608032-Prymnesium_polylepis.4
MIGALEVQNAHSAIAAATSSKATIVQKVCPGKQVKLLSDVDQTGFCRPSYRMADSAILSACHSGGAIPCVTTGCTSPMYCVALSQQSISRCRKS